MACRKVIVGTSELRFGENMKTAMVAICLMMGCVPAMAQSPEASQYLTRPLLLLSGQKGVEAVMPMLFTVNGKQQITYVLGSKIKESIDNGGKPIRLGDVLNLLGEQSQSITKLQAENAALQAENEKLWKVVTKDHPQQQPPTVVVQQPPPPPQPSPAEIEAQREQQIEAEKAARRQQMIQAWIMLQNANRPTTQNLNVTVSNCTRYPALCAGR